MKRKQKIRLIQRVCDLMIARCGSTTTLDVKIHLRNKYPNEKWFQGDISEILGDYQENSTTLEFDDTGVYRLYKHDNLEKVSKTKAIDFLKTNKKKELVVTFEKKDGSTRHMLGRVDPNNLFSNTGYVRIFEPSSNTLKQFDPKKLHSFSFGYNKIEVK